MSGDCNCLIDPSPSVTSAEIEMLNFIREEEKLARDVYLAMHDLYAVNIFRNIAKSEENHMTQVLCLLEDALEVGATIEDKDIFDLEEDMGNTANPAIINTFTKLACASGNHLRSFSALLTNKGISYTPQFISQEEYDGILSLPHQSCGKQ